MVGWQGVISRALRHVARTSVDIYGGKVTKRDQKGQHVAGLVFSSSDVTHMSVKASFTSGPGGVHVTARASGPDQCGQRKTCSRALACCSLPIPFLPPPSSLLLPSPSSVFCSLNIKDLTSLN